MKIFPLSILLTIVILSGCSVFNSSTTLINPVNGEIVRCDSQTLKPGQTTETFDTPDECIAQYQSMGFWKK